MIALETLADTVKTKGSEYFQTLKKVRPIELKPVSFQVLNYRICFSLLTFLRGLVGILAFYILFLLLIWIFEEKTIAHIEKDFASQYVAIIKPESKYKTHQTLIGQSERAQLGGDDAPLEPAPLLGYFEDTAMGPLPKINTDQRNTPFNVYRKPYANPQNRPMISIVLDDFGISDRLSLKALELLPGQVSLMLSPYADKPEKYLELAREDGHEVWMKLPLENRNYPASDPGPNAILSRMSLLYNTDQLNWTLSRAPGYVGVAAFSDSVFTSSEPMFKNIVRKTYERGLAYFEMNTKDQSIFVSDVSNKLATPYLKNDLSLSDKKWKNNMEGAFEAVETIASTRGYAIVTVKPYPEALIAIDLWRETLKNRGFVLAPLSYHFDHKQPSQIIIKAAQINENNILGGEEEFPLEIKQIKGEMHDGETHVEDGMQLSPEMEKQQGHEAHH